MKDNCSETAIVGLKRIFGRRRNALSHKEVYRRRGLMAAPLFENFTKIFLKVLIVWTERGYNLFKKR